MMQSWIWYPFVLAALGSAVSTALVMRLAWRFGAVARPRADRWHQRPTALLGGTAIYFASVVVAAVMLPRVLPPERAAHTQWLGLWGGATVVFLLGVIDDCRGLSPSLKIAGQTVAACLLVMGGIHLTCVSPAWLAVPLTILCVVGIINAVNLLDNMDGVAAGVVAVAAMSMAAYAGAAGSPEVLVLALCLAGACCGFLLYNFHPARIFMGDCGSLYLGFVISALTLAGTMRHALHPTAALIVPIAVLAIPIFDTTLVTIVRRLHGRPVTQGGRDHTTHRLVALGLSEPGVALFLYTGSGVVSALALAAVRLPPLAAVTLAALALLALGLFGVFLGTVRIYPARLVGASTVGPGLQRTHGLAGAAAGFHQELHATGDRGQPQSRAPESGRRTPHPVLRPLTSLTGNRVAAHVMLDVALVPLAFIIAHLLRFDAAIPPLILQRAVALLPVWIAAKIVGMAACRTHSGLWRYAGLVDVLATLKGSTLGSLLIVPIVVGAGGFDNLSRSVLILDWLVFTVLALAVRVGLVLLRHGFGSMARHDAERVVIVGADESGRAAVRQLRLASTRLPVGFVDEDAAKHRRMLDGVPILGGVEDLPRLVRETGAQAVLVPAQAAYADQAVALCGTHGIPCVH